MVHTQLLTITRVTLEIYDVRGRLVRVLVNKTKSAGAYESILAGHNQAGQAVPSGVYFATMRFGGAVRTRKIVLIR